MLEQIKNEVDRVDWSWGRVGGVAMGGRNGLAWKGKRKELEGSRWRRGIVDGVYNSKWQGDTNKQTDRVPQIYVLIPPWKDSRSSASLFERREDEMGCGLWAVKELEIVRRFGRDFVDVRSRPQNKVDLSSELPPYIYIVSRYVTLARSKEWKGAGYASNPKPVRCCLDPAIINYPATISYRDHIVTLMPIQRGNRLRIFNFGDFSDSSGSNGPPRSKGDSQITGYRKSEACCVGKEGTGGSEDTAVENKDEYNWNWKVDTQEVHLSFLNTMAVEYGYCRGAEAKDITVRSGISWSEIAERQAYVKDASPGRSTKTLPSRFEVSLHDGLNE
ncbi:hypothetical protein BDP27DRAFT_1409423 [Rhodocollybia butyracea]|uniref:Uncharacterized protein n=1 Tax=Rhodocollybia butyracea TaxID=206335 RepID=A0A9P5P7I7_9AGAR|nr:hypothetical protein BDP27DRAFT_1409423 [Rhodocollybia butyracea]